MLHVFVIGGPHVKRIRSISSATLPEIHNEIFHQGWIFFNGLIDDALFVNSIGNGPEAFHKHFKRIHIITLTKVFCQIFFLAVVLKFHNIYCPVETLKKYFF